MSTLAERFTTRLPFVVGVTGHRQIDPSDEPRLHAEVRRILDDLRARMPETPILVLCGMATGSDMICAEEALAAGATLCALLPAPLELFERDLNAVEREQLHAALERAAELRVLDAALEPGYVRLAEYIARYSHLVLALWDGAEGRGSGGTADVVSMRVEGLHLDRRLARLGIETQAYPDVGPIVHIPTRRAGGPPVSGETDLRHPPRFEGDS